MSDEQNVIIAEWMGWAHDERWGCLVPPGHAGPGEMFTPYKIVDDSEDDWALSRMPIHENWKGGITRTGSGKPIIPKFSTDLNAMASALTVVKERGVWTEYVWHLDLLTHSIDDLLCEHDVRIWRRFAIATATAAQQAEALCRVIEQEAER